MQRYREKAGNKQLQSEMKCDVATTWLQNIFLGCGNTSDLQSWWRVSGGPVFMEELCLFQCLQIVVIFLFPPPFSLPDVLLCVSLSPTCQHYQRVPSSSQSCFLDSALSHPLPDFFLCSVAACTLPNFAAFRYSVCPAAHGTFIEGTFFNVVRTRVPSLGDYRMFFYVDCFLSLKSMHLTVFQFLYS